MNKPKKLLAVGNNAKTVKGDKTSEYLTAIMYMAPHKSNTKKVNLCPKASDGCAAACLNTAGRGRFTNVQNARVRKADWFIEDRDAFLKQLHKELIDFSRYARLRDKKPAVRLNGTTDIDWPSLIDLSIFPEISFYEYTKVIHRMNKYKDIPNLSLTYSKDEDTKEDTIKDLLIEGHNVAVVFDELPEEYLGYPVIDGDKTDLRFLDPKGVIVGLTAKGDAKKDTSGFVIPIKEII